jgi:uncharacterized protein YceH (UPF0502 family)
VTFVPTLDAETPHRPRVPRILDAVEIRVLGSLMEKQLATPEYYPLTLNALMAACNQKSNREPVMELGESDIERALNRLQDEKMVWRVLGGRAVRFDHNLDAVWHLKRPEKALITLLFLRGPQTAGELRGRSDRLESFDNVAQVEDLLRDMSQHSEPLVRELPRRPGQKEGRWAYTVGGEVAVDEPAAAPGSTGDTPVAPLSVRVSQLETRLAALEEALRTLRDKLGD